MRQTPVNDYLEEISTELPEELYGNLSDAIFETVCDFDEEVAQLKAENARLREQVDAAHMSRLLTENENESLRELSARAWRLFTEHGAVHESDLPEVDAVRDKMRELGVEVDT